MDSTQIVLGVNGARSTPSSAFLVTSAATTTTTALTNGTSINSTLAAGASRVYTWPFSTANTAIGAIITECKTLF